MGQISVLSALLLSSCGNSPQSDFFAPLNSGARQGILEKCIPASISLPLLGVPGDSPILPVQVRGEKAAMFFSPGFVPLLFRNNGPVLFQKFRRVDLRRQDGSVLPASASVAWALSLGTLKAEDRAGYLLPEPDSRTVDGRPVIGLLGRDILPEDAVVDLDLPNRRVTISVQQSGCPGSVGPPPPGSIDMQQEVLLVPVRINGQPVQAILEPDLPVSILPREIARRVGISDADLSNDPSVVTKFGKGVLGRRHHVKTLEVGGCDCNTSPSMSMITLPMSC